MIHAVILSWHDVNDTIECIDSLRRSACPVGLVHLYDNGSTDGSSARLATHYLRDSFVSFVRNSRNLGFARAVNRGIRTAFEMGADRVFIVNNDTIIDPECIGRLAAAMDADGKAAAAMPTIAYHDRPETVWQGGGAFSMWRTNVTVPLKNRPVTEVPDKVESCTFQTGCALLMDKSALERVGLFDERFFFYGEDAELSYRLHKAGYTLLYVPDAMVLHKIGDITRSRMSPFVMYHRARASVLLPRIHFSSLYVIYAVFVQLAVFTPFRIVQLIRGGWNGKALLAWFQGLSDGLFRPDRRRY
jgi:GT2 family glycosyltransferase